MVHPQAGDRLEDPQDLFPLPEPDRHHRRRTEFVTAGADRDEVGGDPVEFHEQHPDEGGPFGDVLGDSQRLLHREAVGGFLEERGGVVHPGAEGDALGPGAVLHVLLDPGVQEADASARFGDGFAVDLEHDPQDPVGGGVLGAHVDDDAFVVGAFGVRGDLVPVAAFCGVFVHAFGAGGAGTLGCHRSSH